MFRHFLAAAAVATLTTLSASPQESHGDLVMQLRVTLASARQIGHTPQGIRTIIPITGGTFEGPRLRGRILPGGADYQLTSADGQHTELDAIYDIQTDDGTIIHVRNQGLIVNKPGHHYFRTSPRFEVDGGSPHAWLADELFTCEPDFSQHFDGIVLNVWRQTPAHAEAKALRLPALFADGMVLQRDRPLTMRGWSRPGAVVSLRLGKGTATTTADAAGRWRAMLPAQKAGGPLQLDVASGAESITLHDVWLGDVWLVSGQSNIDTHIERVYPQYVAELDNDSSDLVRLFQVANTFALDSLHDDITPSVRWQKLSRRNAWHFSALGYFLGKRLAEQTGVHQGIIQSSWGGTPIEAWLPLDSVSAMEPMMAAEARYFDNPRLNSDIAAANVRASRQWDAMLDATDPGMTPDARRQPAWAGTDFDDAAWPTADRNALPLPDGTYCGSFWARQHINIDAAHAGRKARLLVGTLTDADYTYVNGRLVGSTGYQYPPRRYTIPAGLLHEGDNVITVRFVCHDLRPAFIDEKPYRIEFGQTSAIADLPPSSECLPLSRTWRVHEGVRMPALPTMPHADQNRASALWNSMLAPLAPLSVAGVIWYQGESNSERPQLYQRQLTALMHTWRQQLGQPTLPFAIVQLAGYNAPLPQKRGWPILREGQRRAATADSFAAVVPAHDLGEANDIHPLRKKELAARVGDVLTCLTGLTAHSMPRSTPRSGNAKTKSLPAHSNGIVTQFPAVVAASLSGSKVTVTFDQPLHPGAVRGFELSDAEGCFHNVTASASGTQVTLDADGLRLPADTTSCLRVRYAWRDYPVEADLRSVALQPAIPFEQPVGTNASAH